MTIDHGDGLQDNRVTCGECFNFKPAGSYCHALRMVTWRTAVPLRCVAFVPLASDPDQRNGRARWPDHDKTIVEVRELDRVHREKATA